VTARADTRAVPAERGPLSARVHEREGGGAAIEASAITRGGESPDRKNLEPPKNSEPKHDAAHLREVRRLAKLRRTLQDKSEQILEKTFKAWI
jgi:hypothetical protein